MEPSLTVAVGEACGDELAVAVDHDRRRRLVLADSYGLANGLARRDIEELDLALIGDEGYPALVGIENRLTNRGRRLADHGRPDFSTGEQRNHNVEEVRENAENRQENEHAATIDDQRGHLIGHADSAVHLAVAPSKRRSDF